MGQYRLRCLLHQRILYVEDRLDGACPFYRILWRPFSYRVQKKDRAFSERIYFGSPPKCGKKNADRLSSESVRYFFQMWIWILQSVLLVFQKQDLFNAFGIPHQTSLEREQINSKQLVCPFLFIIIPSIVPIPIFPCIIFISWYNVFDRRKCGIWNSAFQVSFLIYNGWVFKLTWFRSVFREQI